MIAVKQWVSLCCSIPENADEVPGSHRSGYAAKQPAMCDLATRCSFGHARVSACTAQAAMELAAKSGNLNGNKVSKKLPPPPGGISSYVVVTHQHSTIRRAVDRIIFLHQGKVVWEGT